MATQHDSPDGWIIGHKMPLGGEALPIHVKRHSPNHKSDELRESDFQELQRLGEVITGCLSCDETPLKNGKRAPCMICRREANRAMTLYLEVHSVDVKFTAIRSNDNGK
jgi:hypothetical protein